MVSTSTLLRLALLLAAAAVPSSSQLSVAGQGRRCQGPTSVAQKIEKDISDCQEEIKLSILEEALKRIPAAQRQGLRFKREVISDDDRRIAGCLLQCVYRKVKAVNADGYPTREGLVRLYTEGVTDRTYYAATALAVQQCMLAVFQRHLVVNRGGSETCDIAYGIFECVSDRITKFCEGS